MGINPTPGYLDPIMDELVNYKYIQAQEVLKAARDSRTKHKIAAQQAWVIAMPTCISMAATQPAEVMLTLN